MKRHLGIVVKHQYIGLIMLTLADPILFLLMHACRSQALHLRQWGAGPASRQQSTDLPVGAE